MKRLVHVLVVFLLVFNNHLPILGASPKGKVFYKAFHDFEKIKQDHIHEDKSNRFSISISQDHYEEYFKDKTLKTSIDIQSNQLHGPAVCFYKNGQAKEDTTFYKNMLHGQYLMYDKGGTKIASYNFNYGKLSGLQTKYYSNGKPKIVTAYKDGKRHGLMKKFNLHGEMVSSKLFDYGKRKLRAGEKSVARKIGEGVAVAGAAVAVAALAVAAAQGGSGGSSASGQRDVNTRKRALETCTRSLRGCCSWHQGIYDVVGNSIMCVDGTYSPSCSCH
ncbi:MAG: hypothetical protein HOA17_03960 [Candidatus Melainabacteria bacterium]|jgi:hypothetical protein|nr:hypothetical protein [Candidatus Melainabacteria bacterium]